MDDSPRAADGLIRAKELAGVGNLDEAAAVLQSLLLEQGERLLASRKDPDLFVTVRRRVHEALQADKDLMARYRALYEPAAEKLLAAAEHETLERAYFLTSAGFEAALRLAQERIEFARFASAVLLLDSLEGHPDLAGPRALAAAELLSLAASYLPEPRSALVFGRAGRWATLGGDATKGAPRQFEKPPHDEPRELFTPADTTDLTDLLPRPLWSDEIGSPLPLESSLNRRTMPNPPREEAEWLFAAPTAVGDLLILNDTHTLTAWDRLTLAPRWRTAIEPIQGRRYAVGPQQNFEELASVATDGVTVVAVMGFAIQGSDTPRRDLLGIDARSGRVLWRRLLDDYQVAELAESRVRGPAVMHEGVVVLCIDKEITRRRLESSYALGLDARTGNLLWTRPLGSSGAMAYGSRPSIAQPPHLQDGVAYFSNSIGFASALESSNGRVIWSRRLPGLSMAAATSDQPWESNIPVLINGRLFVVSPDRQRIIMLDALRGTILADCAAAKFDNPDYLLHAGAKLVGVSGTSLVSADPDAFSTEVVTSRVARLEAGQMRGRVTVFGKQLLVPTIDGFSIYDPASTNEQPITTLALDKPGNTLPLDGQLIVVDDRRVHTYLVWDVAESMLRQRLEDDPTDPGPAITFAELSYRAGRTENIIPAVDRALAAIEADPLGFENRDHQARLFRGLALMLEPGQDAAAAKASLTLDLRAAIVDRLDRCAATPSERATYLLAAGRFFEATDQPGRAVEQYQQILDASELSAQSFSLGDTVVSADFEATRRLRQLIQSHGLGLYDAFQANADRQLAELAEALEPEPFEALARRYPVSRAAVTAWLEASGRYTTQGRSKLAAQALEEGLAAARGALPPTDPLLGELTGRLVRTFASTGLFHPALAAIDTFRTQHAGLALTERGETLDIAAVESSIRDALAAFDRRPAIGPEPRASNPMIDWSIAPPLQRDVPTPVTDRVMMVSTQEEYALFRSKGPGPLERVWGDVRNEEFLWLDTTGAYFSRTAGAGERADYTIVRRDLESGAVLWETPQFRTNFPPGPLDALLADPTKDFVPDFNTPLRPRIPVTETSFVFDRQTLVMIERTGRMAAFDLLSGKPLWQQTSTVPRVHDVDLKAGTLLIGGADAPIELVRAAGDPRGLDPQNSLVLALDARTGQALYRWSGQTPLRWVRLAPEGFAILGLDDAVVSLDAYRGRERWRTAHAPVRASIAAWTMLGRVLIRGEDDSLHQLSTADGTPRETPLDTRDRLSRGFTEVEFTRVGSDAALATNLGLAVFDPQGALVGFDTRTTGTMLLFGAFGKDRAVTLTSAPDPVDGGLGAFYVQVHSLPSLKALSRTAVELAVINADPGPIAVIDGKLLITAGALTLAIDLPVE